MTTLSELLDQINTAMLAGDIESFMSRFDPTSPFLTSMRSYWGFYICENRIRSSQLQVVRSESRGPGEERVWLNQIVQYEALPLQTVGCFMDIILQPDQGWLLKSIERVLPIYGEETHSTEDAPSIPPPQGPPERVSRVILPELEGPEELLEYVAPRYRHSRVNPGITSAFILANMMSEATARLLLPTYHPDRSEWLKRLAAFWYKNVLHRQQARIPSPWPRDIHPMVRNPRQSVDELLAVGSSTHRIIGLCDGLQSCFTAIVLLGGVPSDHVWEVSIEGAVTHAVTVVDGPDGPLMTTARYVMPANGTPFHHNRVAAVYNGTSYWSLHGRSNLTPNLAANVVDLLHRASPNFDLPQHLHPESHTPDCTPSAPLRLPQIKGLSAEGIAAEVRRVVALEALAEPKSVYSHAWYAYQSVHVYHPETYLLASVRSPLVTNLAATLSGLGPILNWFEQNITGDSVFHDPERIMIGEQVIAHRRGGPWDKALLASALASLIGYEARCVLTTESGYLSYRQGSQWRYVDMDSHAEVGMADGTVVSAFDLHSAYHTPAKRFDLAL